MPPKKPAADSADPPAQSSSVVPAKEKSDAASLRKLTTHPSTSIMLREALKALDSRKGVSSQAIQNYIKQKYLSVDVVRLKHSVRRALKKGIESGTLVRPANSNITTGAMGKFRLAPKVKEAKAKTENTDPNVQKEPKAKDGTKKPKKSGEIKMDSKPPKKSKKDKKAVNSKDPPAKKPRGKKTAGDGDGPSTSAKPKAAKTTKEEKAGRATQSKTAKADSDGPATKTTGKRGKKNAE
uniref:H15 domain-containing protein n=1 Tax=Mola mola TaxID=94237 RepID=A0A3Q3XMW0_MOLML